MPSYVSSVVCCCLILTVAAGDARCEDTKPVAAKSASLRLKDSEVKALVKQLGAAKEAEREASVKKLRGAGVAVIPAVADAANKGNKQATNNAIEILKAHVEGPDPEARIAAFEELRRISVGSRPAAAAAAKRIVDDHKDLRAQSDAARLAARERRKERAANQAPTPDSKPQPMPTTPSDPLAAIRRQAIEQSIKDAETAIEKIKKLKLPKELEAQQISAVTQGLQSLRAQLKELDRGGRKK